MRVLVTRPAEDAASLAAALAMRGLEPVVEPLLAIRLRPDAARILAPLLLGAQAVLFTSANGVRAFAAATVARTLPVFAVGNATAAAARRAGFATVESAEGNVEDLGRLVAARLDPARGALVHAAAGAVAGDLASGLAAAGFALRRAVLYDAVPAERLSDEVRASLAAQRIDYALFFSPRTASSFVRLVDAAGLHDGCRVVAAVALSPAVAAALAGLAWRAIRIADRPDEAALLAALDRAIAEERDRVS